jgi:hypothetical protein
MYLYSQEREMIGVSNLLPRDRYQDDVELIQ